MNTAIEKPTKILTIKNPNLVCKKSKAYLRKPEKLEKFDILIQNFKTTFEDENISEYHPNVPLYSSSYINSDPVFDKESMGLNFYEMNEENASSIKNENKNMINKSFLSIEDSRPANIEYFCIDIEFLNSSLKNDIRVKEFKTCKNMDITVYFCTVEDAISFYEQYFQLIQMNFKYENELMILPDFIPITKIPLAVSDSNIIHSFLDQQPFHTFEEKKSFVKNDFEPKNLEEFELRVSYFNKMKNMFSKNEIRKISNFMESGNFEFILINIKELCVGSASNIFIQGMLKELPDENLCRIIKALGSDISAISSTKYGAYAIQTLVMSCYTNEARELLIQGFGNQGRFLVCHEIGNYTIQRILLFNEDYIYEIFKDNLADIINHSLGVKVFKRCLELLTQKGHLLKEQIKKCNFKEGSNLLNEIN